MKTKTLILMCVLFTGLLNTSNSLLAEESVNIPDPNLKAAIENTLGITNPTPEDMLQLINLTVYQKGVQNLTGLEYATNIKHLSVTGNEISDISHLSGLVKLQELYLSENNISDISALSNLTNLGSMNISNNKIHDISPISGLTKLTWLGLQGIPIGDISVISGLKELTGLFLGDTQISDISPISGLTKLRQLWLSNNKISNVSPLSGLTNLHELLLSNNPLNREAYCTYLKLIIENNPKLSLEYDSNPNPPTGISASDGIYTNKVEIIWDAVCTVKGNVYYQIYKSDSEEGTKTALSDWQTSTKYEDTTALPGITCYYQVKAKTQNNFGMYNKTDYSSFDTGWAICECNEYELNISSTKGGSVISPGEGTFLYDCPSIVDINAIADSGYYFVEWTGTAVDKGKIAEPNSSKIKVTMTDNYTLKANFKRSKFDSIYVDDDANGLNNGTSWENAYNFLQDALTDTQNSKEQVKIYVAQGTYKPDLGAGIARGNRQAAFQMINKVSLTGGYAGSGQADPNVRNIELYETILSGDLNGDDAAGTNTRILYYEPSRAENSYRVITGSNIDSTTSLDGFIIKAGNANGTSSSYQYGGGLYTSYCDLTVSNCTFTENSAYQGGGIYNNYGNPKFTNCTFSDNMTESYGGGIYNYHGVPTLTGCFFNANVSSDNGAGMYNTYTNPAITNCTFNWNISNNYGGGIYNDHSNPAIANCSFNVNLAENQGGGINNQYSNPAFSNCTFLWNISESDGGGMYNYQSSPVLANCTFNENIAESNGGGINNNYKSNSTLISCTFNGNSAYYGGGMCINNNSSPTLTECIFSENEAEYSGGGIYNYSNAGNPTLTDCTFSNNTAATYGGGMYNYSNGNATLTSCIFSNNISGSYGGGIYNNGSSNPKLTSCTFNKNTAKYGGGMGNSSTSNPTLSNCIFSENSSDTIGGGMYNQTSNPILNNCKFSSNDAKTDGGGMYNASTSNPSIEKCQFCGNTAGNNGGGMYNNGSKAKPTNCIFSGNRAVSGGGGMYNTNSSNIIIAACTFTGNLSPNGNTMSCFSGLVGRGGAVPPSIIVLKNCILWDENTQIWNNDGSAITISYCDVKGDPSASFDPLGKIVWGAGIIDSDPCFAYPGYWDPNGTTGNSNDDFWVDGDYHLKSQAGRFDPNGQIWINDNVTSLCIDAGDPNNPISYEPIPSGSRINLGAYGGTVEASKSLQEAAYFKQASNPYPADGAVNVILDTMLTWTSDINAIVHEIYLGTGDQPPFVKKTLVTEFTPEVLEPNTYYHWRIDDVDNSFNRMTSNIWSFRTGSISAHLSNPYPANGATGVAISISLRWRPGSYADTYDVYFGTDFNDVNAATITNKLGVLVSQGQDPNYYNPGTLLYNQMYFWRVDEKNNSGLLTRGDIWSFITIPQSKSRGACFAGQTLAWVDGKAVAISSICAGQSIDATDKVEQLLIHYGTFPLYDILLDSGDCITVANEHYFMAESGQWISSTKLEAGMMLRTAKGLIKVKSVTKQPQPFTGKVYNLKIKTSDAYMVGKDAVIVRDY